MWDLPGGFMRPGEDGEQAARRELLEETGLEIAAGRVLAIIPDVYGPDGEPTLNIFYLARVAAGTARPASDVSEIGWFGAGWAAARRPDRVRLRRGRPRALARVRPGHRTCERNVKPAAAGSITGP